MTAAVVPTAGLQAALADEHAAIYGYGVIGPHLTGPQRDAATSAYETHRARRNQITSMLLDAKQTPVAAAPAYDLPFAVTTASDATRLAAQLEERLGTSYAGLVATSDGDARRSALEWLTDSAVRAVRWRGNSVAFPGLPDQS